VGREVIVAAELPSATPQLGLVGAVAPSAAAWQRVGDQVGAGVGPLGGSARSAFGFLLGEAPEDPPPPASPKRGA
jgi:hypothetical protein